jgi:hypothetical protein
LPVISGSVIMRDYYVRFVAFMAVNPLKTEYLLNDIRLQFVPHRKHSMFIVRIIRNTQIHCVRRMQSFGVLKQVVRIATVGL